MDKIEIRVGIGLDSITFAILPSRRQYINNCYPDTIQANYVTINYDINKCENVENFILKYKHNISTILFGIDSQIVLSDDKVREIQFVYSKDEKILYTYTMSDHCRKI